MSTQESKTQGSREHSFQRPHKANATGSPFAQGGYRKAAEQGNAPAQLMLGTAYGAGLGVPQDFAEGYFWFEVAMAGKLDASDMELAAKLRHNHASILTPAELSREQERARKWFEAHPAKPQ